MRSVAGRRKEKKTRCDVDYGHLMVIMLDMKTTTNIGECSKWTTAQLKTAVRELESPENRFAKAGWSESSIQSRMDYLCEELGRREEC